MAFGKHVRRIDADGHGFSQKISMSQWDGNSGVFPLDVDAEVETFEVMSARAVEFGDQVEGSRRTLEHFGTLFVRGICWQE